VATAWHCHDDVVAALGADVSAADTEPVRPLPDDRDGLVERGLRDLATRDRLRGQRDLGAAAKVQTELGSRRRPKKHAEVERHKDQRNETEISPRTLPYRCCHCDLPST
jgi:hypothetical protein